MCDSRPKTKKLRNATPNINLPVIESGSNKFNWKTLSESNVYILKKLPEVSLKESSLNQLDRIELNGHLARLTAAGRAKKKELVKQGSSSSLGKMKVYQNAENLPSGGRPTTNQKLQVNIKCYLCNEQFNGKEIIRHEAKCLERWRRLPSDEKRRAIEEQKRWLDDAADLAELSSESDLADDSHGQWKKFRAILRSCRQCGRSFFEHRLEKHETHCKGRQALGKLAERSPQETLGDGRQESIGPQENIGPEEKIVFVRKTKPLNSHRSTLYRQQQEQLQERPPSNGEAEKSASIAGKSPSTTNFFAKCPQCQRVLKKSNLQMHEKYHARSSSLNQLCEDRAGAPDSRTDHLNGLSLDALSPVNAVDVGAELAPADLSGFASESTKAELIAQLSKQFNPINPTNHGSPTGAPAGRR